MENKIVSFWFKDLRTITNNAKIKPENFILYTFFLVWEGKLVSR